MELEELDPESDRATATWLDERPKRGCPIHGDVAATAGADGRPSVRHVL